MNVMAAMAACGKEDEGHGTLTKKYLASLMLGRTVHPAPEEAEELWGLPVEDAERLLPYLLKGQIVVGLEYNLTGGTLFTSGVACPPHDGVCRPEACLAYHWVGKGLDPGGVVELKDFIYLVWPQDAFAEKTPLNVVCAALDRVMGRGGLIMTWKGVQSLRRVMVERVGRELEEFLEVHYPGLHAVGIERNFSTWEEFEEAITPEAINKQMLEGNS